MKDFFIHQNQNNSVMVGGVLSLMNFAVDNIVVRVKGGLVEVNGQNLIIKRFDDSVNFVNNCGAVVKSVNDLVKKEDAQEERGDQLTSIVKYLNDLAVRENLECKKMWLDSLPEYIYLDNLKKKYGFVATALQALRLPKFRIGKRLISMFAALQMGHWMR